MEKQINQLIETIAGMKAVQEGITAFQEYPASKIGAGQESTSSVMDGLTIGLKDLKESTSAAIDGLVERTEGVIQTIKEDISTVKEDLVIVSKEVKEDLLTVRN